MTVEPEKKRKVLFVCTGNSCRSQMAEGLLRHLGGGDFEAASAGTHPSRVNPLAIRAMEEADIDITHHRSKPLDEFAKDHFDFVITVCDSAAQECPTFNNADKHIHWSIEDPIFAEGNAEERMVKFREVRDVLKEKITRFVKENSG